MWKYKSGDIENISLHDNFINKIQVDGDNILLIFDDGFDVLKTHPLNDTGKSKRTTKSQIVLKKSEFREGRVYSWEQQDKHDKIDFERLLSPDCFFEVLDWILKFSKEDGKVSIQGNICWENFSNREYSILEFSCEEILFCWNDYCDDAWFEEWPENTN